MNAVLLGVAGILLIGALLSPSVKPPQRFARLEFDNGGAHGTAFGWRWRQVTSLGESFFGAVAGELFETQTEAAENARAQGIVLL